MKGAKNKTDKVQVLIEMGQKDYLSKSKNSMWKGENFRMLTFETERLDFGFIEDKFKMLIILPIRVP